MVAKQLYIDSFLEKKKIMPFLPNDWDTTWDFQKPGTNKA